MNQPYRPTSAVAVPIADGALAASGNKVLRNTYMLLSMTLAFSALTAAAATAFKLPTPGLILTLIGYFGLLYGVNRLRNSGWGVALVFALTGFLGYTLGPILRHFLSLPGGSQIVMLAMGGTATIFLGLSAYVHATGKDFRFMGGFLTVGILTAFIAGLAAVLFSIPALSLTVAAVFVLLMSGLILYETSNIIHGGETNYIMATVTLYVTIFNLFTSLLQLLGFANSSD
jgi:modulator of FtsH protease